MKKLLYTLTVICTLLALPTSGFARDTNYTSGASFAWSPYTWTATDYASYSDPSEVVAAFNNVKFNQTATDLHNGAYYLTFEINNTTDNVKHSGWYSSNLPYVKYDRDDDNGNGNYEEIEAIKSYVGAKISAGTAYYFQTSWDGAKGKSGNFDIIVQRSVYNPASGEFEGYHYDLLEKEAWSL